MMFGWSIKDFSVTVFFLLAISVEVFAGTTGKITGQVTDEFGMPLPGVAVVLEHNKRGAETDEEGIYFLLSVEPGRHTLIAHMIGYASVQKTEVLVTSDFTTNVSFKMKEKPLELGEIVVEAQSGSGGWGMMSGRANTPAIEADKTMSKSIIRGEDLEVLTILRDLDSVLELQGGVSVGQDGGELFIRSARSGALAYYLDGLPMPARDHLYSRPYRDINRLAVQEMVVVTGGLDAEYGNAQGGVVSVVTREGIGGYGGTIDYQITPPGQKHWGKNVYDSPIHLGQVHWDDPKWVSEAVVLPNGNEVLAHPRRDYTGVWGHFLEGSLGVPLNNNTISFLSSQWQRVPEPFPAAYQTSPFNLNTLAKFTYKPQQRFKIIGGGLYDRRKLASESRLEREETGDNVTSLADRPILGGALDLRHEGRGIFLNDAHFGGDLLDKEQMFWLGFNHILSERTFYEIRFARSLSERDTANVMFPLGVTHLSDVRPGATILDANGIFAVHRDVMSWNRHRRNRFVLKADLSSQVHKRHFVKTGLEMIRYDNWAQAFRNDVVGDTWGAWYSKTYEQNGFFEGTQLQGVTPIQAEVYIQDKIELDGMIVNTGIRFGAFINREEMHDAKHYLGSPMWNGMTRKRNMPTIPGKTITSWSPRLGISHPMGERSVLRFYYGMNTQFPEFLSLYNYAEVLTDPTRFDKDLNENGQIDPGERWNAYTARGTSQENGSPDLEVEKTTSVEVGIELEIFEDYVAGITTYYKKSDGEIAGSFLRYQRLSQNFNVNTVEPAVFRDGRGLELLSVSGPLTRHHLIALPILGTLMMDIMPRMVLNW
jgi:hypothetical protein